MASILSFHIEHSNEVVVEPAGLFWWEVAVLHFSNGIVGACESFFERRFIEIGDCLFKSFANKINQLCFRRANALSFNFDAFNLLCKTVDAQLDWDVLEFLQNCQ